MPFNFLSPDRDWFTEITFGTLLVALGVCYGWKAIGSALLAFGSKAWIHVVNFSSWCRISWCCVCPSDPPTTKIPPCNLIYRRYNFMDDHVTLIRVFFFAYRTKLFNMIRLLHALATTPSVLNYRSFDFLTLSLTLVLFKKPVQI